MEKLYKYRNFSDPNMESIIKNSSLYFSSVDKFNDPFDCKLSYRQHYSNQEIQAFYIALKERKSEFRLKDIKKNGRKNHNFVQLRNNITQKLRDTLGVLSLSKNFDSILMWSHYSESHTGLVFEFTPRIPKSKESSFYPIIDVEYVDHYEELSYADEPKDEMSKLLLSKYKDWAYEEECRCFALEFQGERKFHKDELTTIIFGAKATEEHIKKMIKLCAENGFNHVKFKLAKLRNGSFALDFEDINI